MTTQQQFDAVITALINREWGKGYLLLIELKNTLANSAEAFPGFDIREDHAEFIEQEFSFSEDELKDAKEVFKALEDYLEDQASD